MKAPFPTMHSTVNSQFTRHFFIATGYRQYHYVMCLQTKWHKAQFCFSFIFSNTTHRYKFKSKYMLCSIYFFLSCWRNNIFGWLEKDKEFNISI